MTQSVELRIGGMTCASCASRVERKLNRMPGVEASVNYATEQAHVLLPDGVSVGDAIATVAATGYTAAAPPPPAAAADASDDLSEQSTDETADAEKDREVAVLRRRLTISAVLAAPVVLLAMVSPLQFDNWQWLSLTLASPVVVWGAWPSTGRQGSTCVTPPRRWTRSSAWGSPPRTGGRSTPCLSAVQVRPTCG